MNDEMQKMDTMTKSMIDKIAKTYHDMNQEGAKKSLMVEGKKMSEYLANFHWDEVRFDPKLVLSEHKNKIQQVSGMDLSMIVRMPRRWKMS